MLWVMALVMGFALPQAQSGETPLSRILECVLDNGDGTHTAFLGYENRTDAVIDLPVGSTDAGENRFSGCEILSFNSGSQELAGDMQPTEFFHDWNELDGRPGRSPFYPNAAFSIDFSSSCAGGDSGQIVWTMGVSGYVGTATMNSNSTPCPEVCGDGILQDGQDEPEEERELERAAAEEAEVRIEECDDGNTENGDGCDENCMIEPFCGDGMLDEGEACDDGNMTDGDGCSANCTIEEEEPPAGGGQEAPEIPDVPQVPGLVPINAVTGSGCGNSLTGLAPNVGLGFWLAMLPLSLLIWRRKK